MAGSTLLRSRPNLLQFPRLLLGLVALHGHDGLCGVDAGYITNTATSEADSILSGKSGENLACDNGAWRAVDGNPVRSDAANERGWMDGWVDARVDRDGWVGGWLANTQAGRQAGRSAGRWTGG